MTYGFLPQCLYGTNTSPVGDIIYKKPYEDRRMQKKKKFIQKKSKYYRQRQKKIRQDLHVRGGCPAAGSTDPDRPGMCRKDKECKLFEYKQRNRRKYNWVLLFLLTAKRTILHLPMELSRLQNLPVTAQIHLLIPKAAILFQQNRSTTPQSRLL